MSRLSEQLQFRQASEHKMLKMGGFVNGEILGRNVCASQGQILCEEALETFLEEKLLSGFLDLTILQFTSCFLDNAFKTLSRGV